MPSMEAASLNPGIRDAVEKDDLNSLKACIAQLHNTDPEYQPFEDIELIKFAAQYERKNILHYLLKSRNTMPLVCEFVAGQGLTDVLKLILKYPDDFADLRISKGQALIDASRSGHTETMSFLIDQNANKHYWADCPLRVAVASNQEKAMHLLLEHGASVEARDYFVFCKSAECFPALFEQLASHHFKIENWADKTVCAVEDEVNKIIESIQKFSLAATETRQIPKSAQDLAIANLIRYAAIPRFALMHKATQTIAASHHAVKAGLL